VFSVERRYESERGQAGVYPVSEEACVESWAEVSEAIGTEGGQELAEGGGDGSRTFRALNSDRVCTGDRGCKRKGASRERRESPVEMMSCERGRSR
jgi:hypothetical protein